MSSFRMWKNENHISDILFCPRQTAVDNLSKEGITQGVHLVGDVMLEGGWNVMVGAEGRRELRQYPTWHRWEHTGISLKIQS